MKKAAWISVTIFLLSSTVSAFATSFSYSANIENTGEKQYKAVKLTPEIYEQAAPNLGDLMLFDSSGEEIPYFINSYASETAQTNNTYPLNRIISFVKDKDYYQDFELAVSQPEDVTATSISFQTDSKDFAAETELWGGYDNIHWELVQKETLYRVDGHEKLGITFSNIKKYTNYRLKTPQDISFPEAELSYNQTVQNKMYFHNTYSPAFSTEENGSDTIIKIKNIKNLKLVGITLYTDSIFKREVSFGGVSKMLYNLNFKNTSFKDLTIALDSYQNTLEEASAVIHNLDDKPIVVRKVEVEYLADEVVFDGGKEGDFILRFGNSEMVTPKHYDINNYREQVLQDGVDLLKIKSITKVQKTEDESKSQERDDKLLFNAAVILIAVLMAVIIILKLRKKPN